MEKRTKHLLIGFAAGVTAAAVLPVLLPVLSESGRPITKALLKRSLLALENIRAGALRVAESLEDLMAEVRTEVDSELAAKAAARQAAGAQVSTEASARVSDVAAAGARWYVAATSGLKSRMAS
jgi:hypothetical protein